MFKKIILVFLLMVTYLFGMAEDNVVMNKYLDKKYKESVFDYADVLITEARLLLQKKYKKTLTFIPLKDNNSLVHSRDKKDIILKDNQARYFVQLIIDEKKCKNNTCLAYYELDIYDGKKNLSQVVKTKAKIDDNEVVTIKKGHLRAAVKSISSFMKKR